MNTTTTPGKPTVETSQVHNPAAAEQAAVAGAKVQRALEEGVDRMTTWFEECAKGEKKAAAQIATGIDEMARLQRESLAYSLQLAAEVRKAWLDGARTLLTFAAAKA